VQDDTTECGSAHGPYGSRADGLLTSLGAPDREETPDAEDLMEIQAVHGVSKEELAQSPRRRGHRRQGAHRWRRHAVRGCDQAVAWLRTLSVS
jgi:hypothetical protein